MNADNGQESTERGQFPHTRWSLVIGAQGNDEKKRREAMSELCEIYWYPLYAYVRRRGLSPADAEDATQGFFCELLAKDRVQLFSEEKGKLRAYLLTAIKRYLGDQAKANRAAKRGGGQELLSLDMGAAEDRYAYEPPEFDTPEKLFEVRWALTLLDRAFSRVKQEYARLEKADVYDALKGLLAGDRDVSFREIGENLGITEGAARITLFRMRKLYRRYLEEEIAETIPEGESVNDEIDYLNQVFAT
ncbi:MAG: sigma-70 family RNA polymerase sigma factor [Verrucomicrobiae bacterium]|nr:sigma-70 family RNA polymerase sigma factor [Verrucomicrobiae bacterium]